MVDLRGAPRLLRAARHAARERAGRFWRSRPEFRWLAWWLVAGLLALIALPLNVALAAEEFGVHPLVAFGAGIAQSTALVLVLVRLRWATALQFVAVAVFAVALPPDSGSTWPLTVTGMFTVMAHVGLVAARYPLAGALVVWWAGAALVPLLVLLDPRGRSFADGMGMMIVYAIFSALVLGVVLLTRRWREIRRELAVARHDVEVEQSQRAAAEERARIARELHDVVAHSMSVIHMQATSAAYRLPTLEPAAREEFTQIAAGARSALREMRQLLTVLRDESADAELRPMPGLGRLAELVESAERAGLPVELRCAEVVLPSEGIALAAYRIVQESLSNVIRHAPGAATVVCVEAYGPELVVSVVNDAPTGPAPDFETAGHGLRGMRERARLVGGTVETGPRYGGGYRVVARLPIGGPG